MCGRAASYCQKSLNRPQLGIAHRVLDVLVPEPCLQRPRVVAGIGQGVVVLATIVQVQLEQISNWDTADCGELIWER
jgi:hypothetical protein